MLIKRLRRITSMNVGTSWLVIKWTSPGYSRLKLVERVAFVPALATVAAALTSRDWP